MYIYIYMHLYMHQFICEHINPHVMHSEWLYIYISTARTLIVLAMMLMLMFIHYLFDWFEASAAPATSIGAKMCTRIIVPDLAPSILPRPQ